jgi:hypothetical protein
MLFVVVATIWYFFFRTEEETFKQVAKQQQQVQKQQVQKQQVPQFTAAIAYQFADYKGKSMFLREGNYNMKDLIKSGMNDSISSFKLFPGYVVKAYQHDAMGGRVLTLTSSQPFVGRQFNDTISSISIKKVA